MKAATLNGLNSVAAVDEALVVQLEVEAREEKIHFDCFDW